MCVCGGGSCWGLQAQQQAPPACRSPPASTLPPPLPTLARAFQPDIIHCSSPGMMWGAALLYSRLLKAPLVYSYHTHVPEYMPR